MSVLSVLPAFSAGMGQVTDEPPALPPAAVPALPPPLPATPVPLPAVAAPPLLVPAVEVPPLLVPPPLTEPPTAGDPPLPAEELLAAPPPATAAPAVPVEPAWVTLAPPLPPVEFEPSGSLLHASTPTDNVKANVEIECRPGAQARETPHRTASRCRGTVLVKPRLGCFWRCSLDRLINDLQFTPQP
jgi:hypothetical protein